MSQQDTNVGEINNGFENDHSNYNSSSTSPPPAAANGGDSLAKTSTELTPEMRALKFKIMKNVIIISFAFLLNFTAFNSMAFLQSSLNKKYGTYSLSVIYGSLVISCAFVPSWLIGKLKTKLTIPVCILAYSTYIAAQFHPEYYTLIPTAFILGMGAAPMWSAKCSYLTQVGARYGEIVGEKSEVVVTRFFGIFFLFFQSSQVWGNLISSTVLSSGIENFTVSDEALTLCGSNQCPVWSNDTSTGGDDGVAYTKRVTMSVIYLCCSVVSAIVVFIFVDPLSKLGIEENIDESTSGKSLLVATFTHMKNSKQILIIPLTMWSGLEQGYFSAEFTNAFVGCGIGVHMIGYVIMCYGVTDALCSICFTPFVKRFGRVPVFSLGAFLNIVTMVVMSLWQIKAGETVVFFIIAILWGISDAIWQTQINAFYGVIFPGESEAAFSNYRLWESLGFIWAYAWEKYLCITSKLYTFIPFLIFAMITYYALEFIERKKETEKQKNNSVVPMENTKQKF